MDGALRLAVHGRNALPCRGDPAPAGAARRRDQRRRDARPPRGNDRRGPAGGFGAPPPRRPTRARRGRRLPRRHRAARGRASAARDRGALPPALRGEPHRHVRARRVGVRRLDPGAGPAGDHRLLPVHGAPPLRGVGVAQLGAHGARKPRRLHDAGLRGHRGADRDEPTPAAEVDELPAGSAGHSAHEGQALAGPPGRRDPHAHRRGAERDRQVVGDRSAEAHPPALHRGRHRSRAPRGRPPGRAAGRGGREPGEERIPRQHEPRDPHPDERRHRDVRAAPRHRARARAARVRPPGALFRGDAAGGDQRHPRLLPNRGGKAGI